MAFPFLIGIGSPYGDDQVGWQVVQAVHAAQLPLPAQCCAAPATTLLPLLQQHESVILVDAVAISAPIGSVQHWLGVQTIIDHAQTTLSTHGFNLATLLALAQNLDILPQQVQLYGVVIDPNSLPSLPDLPLSPPVAAAVEELVERFRQLSH